MKQIKSLTSLFVIVCFLLCSCGKAARVLKVANDIAPKTVYTSDIDIRTINGVNYAYYRGEVYSGDVFSNNEKHKMVIRNGLAVVAYGNYGANSGTEKELEIRKDRYTLEQEIYQAEGTQELGKNVTCLLYTKPMLGILNTLPDCSFSR